MTAKAQPAIETPEVETAIFSCQCPNIWTSKGKLYRGEMAELPVSEIENLKKVQDEIMGKLMARAYAQ